MSKYSLGFVIANIVLFAIHLVLGFLGYISIVAVVIVPGIITWVSVLPIFFSLTA